MLCPTCKIELRGVAGGISKKGNRFESFWGHSQGSKCETKVPMSPEDAKIIEQQARAKKLDAEITKFKGMAWFNSVNVASTQFTMKSPFDFDKFREIRDWCYKESMAWFIKNVINEE